MPRLRILLAGVPRLLADILVDVLSRDSRFEVECLDGPGQRRVLADALKVYDPQVILVGEDLGGVSLGALQGNGASPHPAVIVIATPGRKATIHGYDAVASEISDIGLQELIDSILAVSGIAPQPPRPTLSMGRSLDQGI